MELELEMYLDENLISGLEVPTDTRVYTGWTWWTYLLLMILPQQPLHLVPVVQNKMSSRARDRDCQIYLLIT